MSSEIGQLDLNSSGEQPYHGSFRHIALSRLDHFLEKGAGHPQQDTCALMRSARPPIHTFVHLLGSFVI